MIPTKAKAVTRPFLIRTSAKVSRMPVIARPPLSPCVSEGAFPIRLRTGTRAKDTNTAPAPARMAAGPPLMAARTFCLAAMATTTGM